MRYHLNDFQESVRNSMSDDQKRHLRRTASSVCQVIIIVSVLFTGGLFTGYWWRDMLAVERRAQMEEMHRKDLAARAEEYGASLKILSRALEVATARVERTAERVGEIAETTEVAADTAKKAAQTVNRAVAAQTNVPPTTREQVNRSVDRANAKGAR